MHDKPVSLIAMDMDGTLLDSRQSLTPGNLAALRKAQAAGIHLAICSGRLPGDVAMFLAPDHRHHEHAERGEDRQL